MINNLRQKGFTLVEIAIVLLIVTILLGYTMAMVPIQQELKQYKQADAEMNKITEAIYAFAQVNGYLPCPAMPESSGLECRDINANGAELCKDGAIIDPDPALDSCDVWYGFVPGKSLGIEGKYSDTTGLLLDPWGKPYRYQVAQDNNPVNPSDPANLSTGLGNFVIFGDMRKASIAPGGLAPDLSVCTKDPTDSSQNDTTCNGAGETIINEAPVVILSTGKDRIDTIAGASSWGQKENLDNSTADTVFVKTTKNDSAGSEFDDLVKWISPNILYSKMIEAGQLP